MIPYKFIPPKDNDTDFNPEIDEMIQLKIDEGYDRENDFILDIRDSYEEEIKPDDLIDVLWQRG